MSRPQQKARDIARESFYALCDNVGSDVSATLKQMVINGSYLDYASFELDPSRYDSARTFQLDYACLSYLRKYTGFSVDQEELRRKAILDFEQAEIRCSEVNNRLSNDRSLSRDARIVLHYARCKIRDVLGVVDLNRIAEHCEWGNGATESIPLRYATVDKKMLEPQLSVTPGALTLLSTFLTYDLHWSMARNSDVWGPSCPLRSEFRITDVGRFATVPKTVKSLRSIDIQPTGSLFLQKGIGSFIRTRLKRNARINLDDQSRNQILASQAQILGLSTIDLASASDSISRELVRQLLTDEWYDLLDSCRTHFIRIDGKVKPLHKFSAMGNGFTFELESLVFYALCIGVAKLMDVRAVISIYGDDIIVSREIAENLIKVLDEVGFKTNLSKTFIDGRFFESCGKHYFDGQDVTPIFQKEVICDDRSAYRAANRLRRLAATFGRSHLDSVILASYDTVKKSCKRLLSGPSWLEGDGFIQNPFYWPDLDVHGSFTIREYRDVPRKRRACEASLLATTLRRGVVTESPFNGFVDIRGEVRSIVCTRKLYMRTVEVPTWACTISTV